MPWVCPLCSSNNEDSAISCYICGAEKAPVSESSSMETPSDAVCTLTAARVISLGLTGHITIPEKYNVIGEAAFKGRRDILSVTFHKNVKKVLKEAFSGCTALENINISHKLETVSKRAFANCIALPASEYPEGEYVASDAFYIAPRISTPVINPITSPTPAPRPAPSPAPAPAPSYSPSHSSGEMPWYVLIALYLISFGASTLLVPLLYHGERPWLYIITATVIFAMTSTMVYEIMQDDLTGDYLCTYLTVPINISLSFLVLALSLFFAQYTVAKIIMTAALVLMAIADIIVYCVWYNEEFCGLDEKEDFLYTAWFVNCLSLIGLQIFTVITA